MTKDEREKIEDMMLQVEKYLLNTYSEEEFNSANLNVPQLISPLNPYNNLYFKRLSSLSMQNGQVYISNSSLSTDEVFHIVYLEDRSLLYFLANWSTIKENIKKEVNRSNFLISGYRDEEVEEIKNLIETFEV